MWGFMEEQHSALRFFLINFTLFFIGFFLIAFNHNAIAKPHYPAHLTRGDEVTLISPSHFVTPDQIQFATERLQALGLRVHRPTSLLDTYGQFAGTAKARAEEIHAAYRNPKIKALFAVRGGSGAGNVLPHLDYDLIQQHPKIIIGFSDITALLMAIQTKTNTVTYHGPVIGHPIPIFTADYLREVLFKAPHEYDFSNPIDSDVQYDLIQTEDRTFTINPGKARGKLLGGNLTVLTSLIGTEYLPKDWRNTILFIEDVNEEAYRIDVMLGQLQNAGVLNQISGFVFGSCESCENNTKRGFQLQEVLNRYLKPLNIPAYRGAMIGHQANQFTLPVGAKVEIDANRGVIKHLVQV